ncbi:hypothetical protein V6N13_129250 [Hibiscus sabdariffa]|uniref:Wound-responsive family protein n=1 Tax=Hibiscus sabdariffa TaxID=183260 RepID=A0ABR2SLI2_9ROSI
MSGGAVAASKAWVVAATIGAVEALKDQGICRWNYTLRSLHQHAKNNLRSSSFFSSSAVAGAVSNQLREEKRRKAERNMKKVLEMNSWGPNTVRF